MSGQHDITTNIMKDLIKHNGTIQSIEGNHLSVLIVQAAACSGCKAKDMCMSSESKEKTIDVYDPLASRFTVGEEVVVCSALTAGKVAVRLAFGIPLAIILVWVFISTVLLHMHELLSFAGVVVLLTLYFCALHKLQHRFDKVLTFWIEK